MTEPQHVANRHRPPRRYVKACACGSTDRRRTLDTTGTEPNRVVWCDACGVELYRFPSATGRGR